MKINQEISMETQIPFLSVQDFTVLWQINEHAGLKLSGMLNPNQEINQKAEAFEGTDIKISLTEEFDHCGDAVLFHGQVQKTDIKEESGIRICYVEAVSASIKLDQQRKDESFQNPSLTGSQIAKEIVTDAGGSIICTAETKEMEGPVIRYQETEWEFLKRISSYQNSYVIPDIKTGKVNIWFGMRQGNEISEDLSSQVTEIMVRKEYLNKGKQPVSKMCRCIQNRKNYSLGDWMLEGGAKQRIFAKTARFEAGDICFFYELASERDLQTKPLFQEDLIGLGLSGTVESREKETLHLTYDMDQKKGAFAYPWRPQTGNALYALPEAGAKAMVYVPGHDEREAIAVCCPGTAGKKPGNKLMKTLNQAEIRIQSGNIELKKENEYMKIEDGTEVLLSGNKLEIEAAGSVNLKAKGIYLSAAGDLKATIE